MLFYTDLIDHNALQQYENISVRYIKNIVDMFYRQRYKEFCLDIMITISHDDTPYGDNLYNVALFVEPLYMNQRIAYGDGQGGGYTAGIALITYGFNTKLRKKEKFEIYFEDDFSDLFSEVEDILIELKNDILENEKIEFDTFEYPERKIFCD